MQVLKAHSLAASVVLLALAPCVAAQQPSPVFRSTRELVSIDVVVRDRQGNIVRGLTQADFEIREDGRAQEVLTFSLREIVESPPPESPHPAILAAAEARLATASTVSPSPIAPETFAGRRLVVLLFDTSSMQPEEVQRAVDSARTYVATQMSAADLVAVATIDSTLDILTEFTGDREEVTAALGTLAASDGLAKEMAEANTVETDEAATTSESSTSELDLFNNDVRLKALRVLAETLSPIEQKKAILYFSGGMQRSGQDNQVELRAAVNAAVRGHVAIYPVDSRGLQAIVPGGDAGEASGRGQRMFSGRGVADQFDRLTASQDTLVSLAEDTGGRAFTDTNDFRDAFSRVQRDLSSYYLLGYSSTNTIKDGRFRKVSVRLKKDGYRVEARPGYYAPRDFAHTSRGDRQAQLEDQLFADVSSTDVPVLVSAGFFRLAPDRYYVPISVAIPGSSLPAATPTAKLTVDVAGVVRDEQGRPFGRMRETMDLEGRRASLDGKQVLYQSGVTLPPGRYAVKFVVRENINGAVGSFEVPVIVPDLKQAPVKVSSVVLSTQVQPVSTRSRSDNPLRQDGVELIPNVTHVLGHDQKLYVYFEVYEPGTVEGGTGADLIASLTFFRGTVKVMETTPAERFQLDAADRKAAVFRLEVPAGSLKPGFYVCQVNVIDAVTKRFAFPRLALLIR